jgi:hypothetical protein
VLTESREAKIRLFTRLFDEFVESGCATPIDHYDEYLLLLDEISERAFKLLLILERQWEPAACEHAIQRLQRTGRADH